MHHTSYFAGLILITSLLLGACQSANTKSRPDWINDPGDGAVGSAVTHVSGRHYQEELAISRARARLAARFGVEVSSVQTIREKVVNQRAYVSSERETFQQVSNATVKAHVREIWHDRARDEIWVWVYPVNQAR